ncbi:MULTISPECIES: plasmid mobilization protein [Rhizobium]|uniref:Plasmid mobilization relaxosome protein MobC n=1 Tax=Rhizobium rhododendri TaxID=2506430 RepID=A0ABY8ISE5_9HYPH|nr:MULTISPECIES: plasmid mobilization relaxosome protein MobC [Rhizobium]MBZ5763378.1 plasmid mobilization relaxosome protein MobC [Rhizobium sp. VS19-DR96]MBZ5769252.1 plasmid mobilization relaxosome protein MobC [Rhizobium sp. VS19-DR129.2]MBZ5776798.1 plasmid mobilization relaxosome protein MobC [Rhizobium sp. VS19-DRK62.2]MBZ5787897.1 plasmid mobilization relaxosome protein MobC [Rhizobium sp. VS19-DR121]MBZ5805398.1 plasmid mobilization relaxosome protein MobC [Rhizobium sp. VS19-DR181]
MSKTSIAHRRPSRNRSVRVRLSEAEFAALTKFAEEAALPTSEVLRRLAREAGGFGPTFEGEVAQRLKATVVQLRKVGVNLNQIARALNSGRVPGYEHLHGGVERLARLVVQHEREIDALRASSRARARRLVGSHV